MISINQAFEAIMNTERTFGEEKIYLEKASGRILAEQIIATSDLPPFNRVMMDGVAVKADTVKVNTSFPVGKIIAAGNTDPLIDMPCEIMTGAVMPSTLDTVIPYEHIKLESGICTILQDFKKGQNVHLRSSDSKEGDILISAHTKLCAAEIGVAASMGYSTVRVFQKPRVVILTSGDELVEVGVLPNSAQIRASNGFAISSAITPFSEVIEIKIVSDKIELLFNSITHALEKCDILIITGGVSAGKYDYIPEVLKSLAAEILFHKIAQKPGKPMLFATRGNQVIFGLPGNPVSCLMCTHAYIIPWIKKNTKYNTGTIWNKLPLAEDYYKKGGLTFFLPVRLSISEGAVVAHPVKNNGSGDFASLVDVHGWFVIPEEMNEVKKGFKGHFIPLKPLEL